MLRETSGKTKAPTAKRAEIPPSRVRFPGIIAHAKALKVSRFHLYLVLTGQRTSHRLMQRYQKLTNKAA